MHFNFETINLIDMVIAIAVSIALILSIFYGTNELSMNIVSGLFGYIGGGAARKAIANKEENK